MAETTTGASAMLDAIDRHISKAGARQTTRRGGAPQGRPRTWAEIDAYAEWVGAIRAREALLALREEVAR